MRVVIDEDIPKELTPFFARPGLLVDHVEDIGSPPDRSMGDPQRTGEPCRSGPQSSPGAWSPEQPCKQRGRDGEHVLVECERAAGSDNTADTTSRDCPTRTAPARIHVLRLEAEPQP